MDRINLAQDRGNWWPVVNTVMNFRAHKTREILCFLRNFQLPENGCIRLLVLLVGWLVGWLISANRADVQKSQTS